MFQNQGFDVEDYKYLKETVGNVVERVKQFVELELTNQNGGGI